MADSILTKEQQEGVGQTFDRLLERAQKAPPKLEDFEGEKANEQFKQAHNAYYSNPLLKTVAAIDKQRDDQIAGSASLDKAAVKGKADSFYTYEIENLKAQFMHGANGGYVDPAKSEQTQKSAISKAMNRDIFGAIKDLLLGIPFVGDYMAAAGKWLMSQFTDKKPLSFTQAHEKIVLERSMKGGFNNIGVGMSDQGIKGFVDGHYSEIKKAAPKAAVEAATGGPDVPLDVEFTRKLVDDIATGKAKDEVQGLIDKKQIVFNDDGKAFATLKAIETLNGFTASPGVTPTAATPLTGRNQQSWEAGK